MILEMPLVKEMAIWYDSRLFLKIDIYRGFLV